MGSVGTWWLAVPLPALDEATLYYRDGGGQWQRQEAGDSRAISRWALRGRYPVFAQPAEVGVPMRYYLQLRHSRVPFSALPFAINDAGLITLRQNEHMLLGIYFGLAILAVALATANAVAYRDSGFAAYAVHVAALSGAQAVLTGLTSLYRGPNCRSSTMPARFFWPACRQRRRCYLFASSASCSAWRPGWMH